MMYNVLNGDSLAHSFPEAGIVGNVVVFREALIDGDVSGDNLRDFWASRAGYAGLSAGEYQEKVVGEIEKILHAPAGSEFNLWFEYDLFCQVNMWFVISLLDSLPTTKKVFAVYSTHLDKTHRHFWAGFGPATAGELQLCFSNRILLNDTDLRLGSGLWRAYKHGDLDRLTTLATRQSVSFPHIREVVDAHAERLPADGGPGRPERVIAEIVNNGSTDFHEVFREFWKRESIYGFGDVQFKRLYDNVMHRRS